MDVLVSELMLSIKQIVVVEENKEYTYPVDLLANAITELMWKQGKTLHAVDLDKLEGSSRQQLLDLLDFSGNLKHISKLFNAAKEQIDNELGQKYLDSLKPLLLKINTLGITKIFHPSLPLQHYVFVSSLNKIPITTLKNLTWKQLHEAF